MITDTIAITRGAGGFSKDFDFSVSSPVKDIITSQLWMFQVIEKVSPRVQKASLLISGGGDDQILLDTTNDIVTVYLSEKEKNEMPDSGYSYKLYWFNDSGEWEVMAYGDITTAGDPPGEYEVESIPYVNDDTDITVTADYTVSYNDNIIYTDPGAGNTVELQLPDLTATPRKRYIIIPLSGDYTVISATEEEGTLLSGATTPKTIRCQSSTGYIKIY